MAVWRGGLAVLLLLLPLFLVILAGAASGPLPAASSEAFDSVLGNTASCHRACQLTYPLHTYPKEEELYACQRGCRLFSICQFVDDGADLNRTKQECDSACTEAYSQSDEQYACHLGCQNQLPFAELRQEQLMSLMPRIHLLFPLTLVRSFWSDMMDSAQSFITSSWTFYLQADDGKIVIFQSKPEVQYVPQLDQETGDTKGSLLLSKTASNRFCTAPNNRTGFLCDDRVTCVPASWVCDSISNCRNGEDEQEQLCGDLPHSLPGFLVFYCSDRRSWVYADQRCNGMNDCGDCSDETWSLAACPPCGQDWWSCSPVHFQFCSCVPRRLCRDGVQHCLGWSDEFVCTA
ncbi:hypothetical protein DUI87_14959 [Hirundo rustica rustica]|uniref:Transmembrane protein 59 n=1 Tax=Hirundo rustica rustica TaxID=333673 RepID=A0A3M0KCA4_HIRRU|nr:hypothetical protein DUI87_14959 [Hirundo rustica rustica]